MKGRDLPNTEDFPNLAYGPPFLFARGLRISPAPTYACDGDLDEASAAILKILDAAPRATTKYKDVGTAGRAVLKALSAAVRDYTEAESAWLRWEREKVRGR